uniref:t-SNARE coiled-coil homology domain-containing protein n=1 Tax=Mantoniella antarctica TaxID=81844 RepID=A0A7S0SIH5_9CHLO|mmetsp:Transcript_39461/g.63249  ORF Transcript_39461/g.63249 Transcript_39461/m.63249 type:complete len:135 (+) Transcript_39461:502-906(+)
MAYRGGYSAGGLTARPGMGGAGGGGASGEVQLNMGNDFDIDDEVDKLHGKVSALRQMTGAIHEEATVRGKMIDQLEDTMNRARSALKDARRRMDKAFTQSSSGHLLVLTCFCLFVCLGFYALYKMGKFVKFFTG